MREQYFKRLNNQANDSKSKALQHFSQAQLDYIQAIDEILGEENLTFREYRETLLLYVEMTEEFCENLQIHASDCMKEIEQRKEWSDERRN